MNEYADYWRRAVALIRIEQRNDKNKEADRAALLPNADCPTCADWNKLTATLVGLSMTALDQFIDSDEWLNQFTLQMDRPPPLDESE